MNDETTLSSSFLNSFYVLPGEYSCESLYTKAVTSIFCCCCHFQIQKPAKLRKLNRLSYFPQRHNDCYASKMKSHFLCGKCFLKGVANTKPKINVSKSGLSPMEMCVLPLSVNSQQNYLNSSNCCWEITLAKCVRGSNSYNRYPVQCYFACLLCV